MTILQMFLLTLAFLSNSSWAHREGSYRIPSSNTTAISTRVDVDIDSRNNILVTLPDNQRLQLYQISGNKLIEDAEQKQFYVDFAKTEQVTVGNQLNFSAAYLSREIILQLSNKFNPENDSFLISKMNSASKDEWKEAILGVDSSDITRLAGLAELKRRYQDLDEHLSLMMDENYSEKDFGNSYFIPTGFIKVELKDGQRY